MLIIPPPKFRKRRGRLKGESQTPATPTLILVAATYVALEAVILTFDRAIDVAAIDPTQFIINDDQETGWLAQGYSATQKQPTMVTVHIDRIGDATGSGLHMTVSASNGIVAADDGGVWPGVTNLALPFP